MPIGSAAYETRIELARQAERSLDLQTFILHGDASGACSFARSATRRHEASAYGPGRRPAHRQRERLLSDLAAFERVEVRLVNPFVRLRGSRAAKLLSSLDELSRVNHRMHNKVFIADNALAIFGGRNIGDEYFMRAEEGNFLDLDVLTAGEAVCACRSRSTPTGTASSLGRSTRSWRREATGGAAHEIRRGDVDTSRCRLPTSAARAPEPVRDRTRGTPQRRA